MGNYVQLSLETHLFFARIMKEHGLFLEVGFPRSEQAWIRRADWFTRQFEKLLRDTVQISDGRISKEMMNSNEMVTELTIPAERRMEQLSGIAIDSRITRQQSNLGWSGDEYDNRNVMMAVGRLNQRAMELVEGLIEFKENILQEVANGRLYNANYPLLIEHILREAKMYRSIVKELMANKDLSFTSLRETEEFWNQIMMEHALFIRGLLDPSETELIETAHQFAMEYKDLLNRTGRMDEKATKQMENSLEKTLRYRDFKAAGAEGILNCEVASIIFPLLADHVLREANHYIRLLENYEYETCNDDETYSRGMQNVNTCNCSRQGC